MSIFAMKERWARLRMLRYDEFNVPTCGNIAVDSYAEKDSRCGTVPELDMFGSMPWCSFPWHMLLPRLTQKNCYTVYGLNLFHEFTSFFSTKVIFAGYA